MPAAAEKKLTEETTSGTRPYASRPSLVVGAYAGGSDVTEEPLTKAGRQLIHLTNGRRKLVNCECNLSIGCRIKFTAL
jgi:hypothetical protein